MERSCTTCGVANNGSNFHKGSPAKDGYHSKCKKCKNEKVLLNRKRYPVDPYVISKTCSRCKIEQPSETFHTSGYEKDGRNNFCKGCRSTQRKKYYTQEHRASLYNISIERLNEMLSLGCMICGSYEKLGVDHDHSCCDRQNYSCGSCVRGVLCSRCNVGLSHFKDNSKLLNKAKKYLKKENTRW